MANGSHIEFRQMSLGNCANVNHTALVLTTDMSVMSVNVAVSQCIAQPLSFAETKS